MRYHFFLAEMTNLLTIERNFASSGLFKACQEAGDR